MTHDIARLVWPSRANGFASLSSLGEWFIEHIEIVLFVTCLLTYQYFAYQRTQYASEIVHHPQKRDFFFVDYFALDKKSDPKHRYVPLKVLDVSEQEVTFKIGNIAHSTPASPRDHMKFDNAMRRNFYRHGTLTLSKEQIENLFNSGVIYNARRPTNIYIDGWVVLSLAELNAE